MIFLIGKYFVQLTRVCFKIYRINRDLQKKQHLN